MNRFSGLPKVWKTVETVMALTAASNTPLKRGVNEIHPSVPGRTREKCSFAYLARFALNLDTRRHWRIVTGKKIGVVFSHFCGSIGLTHYESQPQKGPGRR
jgi:hypothetical protein